MKIVILVRIFWSAGAQLIAIKEAKQLQKMGNSVKLIFLRRAKSWRVYEDLLEDIDYKVVSESRSSFFSGIYGFITGLFMPDRKGEGRLDYDLLKKFPDIVEKYSPDKIICHDEWAGYAGYLANKKLNVPYEVFIHERLGDLNVPIFGRLARNYRKKSLTYASKIYSVTEKIAIDTRKRFGYCVIPNPPGFESDSLRKTIQTKKRIISVSFWDRPRNPFFFIALEKELPEYEIMLLGNWRDELYYKEFISNLPDDTRITTLRGVTEGMKAKLISESKYLVRFGKLEFGLATAVMESISNGIPVIINEELGTANLISEHNAGFVLAEADPKLVAKLIMETKQDDYDALVENVLNLRVKLSWEEHASILFGLDSSSDV